MTVKSITFLNPDGRIVVELMNDGKSQKKISVAVYGNVYECALPAQSFATLLVDKG